MREGLPGDLLAVRKGVVTLPGGVGLGLEPDLKPLEKFRSLHIERRS
jgi:hypothetical protein